jgi:hypothetical protein
MATVDQAAVRNRNSLSQADFKALNEPTQKAVVNAKLTDSMLKPAMQQATKLGREAVSKMRESLKGDGENSA